MTHTLTQHGKRARNMSTNTLGTHHLRWLAAGAFALALTLTACGGSDEVAEAPPIADDAPAETDALTPAQDLEPIVSEIALPTPTTTLTPTTTTTAAPTTTTVVTTTSRPPITPAEPIITVECATNPPHVSVTFGDPDVALDWAVGATLHPGGTGLPSVENELGTGTQTPVEPLSFEVAPNTLGIFATTTNAHGDEARSSVGVGRFTGCPVPNTLAAVLTDSIDCVTGAFTFAQGDAGPMLVDGEPFDRSIDVESIVVERWNGPSESIPVNEAGRYWVRGWDGPEEVKVVATFTAADGTHEQHINHYCFGTPFGDALGTDYKVCSDERLHVAYPQHLTSNIELDGPEGNSCRTFYGPGPDPEYQPSDQVTITSLGSMTLDEAAATLATHESITVTPVDAVEPSAYSNPPSGLRRDVERRSSNSACTATPNSPS